MKVDIAVQSAFSRVAIAFYGLGVSSLALLRVYELEIGSWAHARQLHASELLWLARLLPLVLAVIGVVVLTVTVWQTAVLRYQFGAASATSSRLRAYVFVPIAIVLFIVPLYLARI